MDWKQVKKKIGNGKFSYIPLYLKYINNQYFKKDIGGLYSKINNIINYNFKSQTNYTLYGFGFILFAFASFFVTLYAIKKL